MNTFPEPGRLSAGTVVGSYTIERMLGRGGMGEVYLATDTRLHRPVALKVLPADLAADSDRRTRFEREARMAAALRHPHICTIHEVGEADGRAFIAMEFVEGTTLQDRVRVDLFSVKESLEIAIQIADALDEARQRGVVHRDLKSANIMLTPRGDVKILDFGLAKQTDDVRAAEATTAAGLTGAGVVIGTAAYMSPEQALGLPLDHRSDLFSFGVVLYELLTGRLPFSGKTSMELFSAILHETPPAIPRFNEAVPDPLVRVVGKLLEKDREQRYQSAREVVTDLRKIREEGATASVAGVAHRTGRRAWFAAAATLLIAGTLGAWWWLGGGSASDEGATSLVVLPAEVFGEPSVAWLADAVPAWITTELSQVEGLDTRVPPKSQDVHKLADDPERVAQAYGVGRYVTSKVFAAATGISLTVYLVEHGTRRTLWSQKYDGGANEYLSVVTQAAQGLRAAVRPAAPVPPAVPADARHRDAAVALQRGLYHSNLFNNTHDPPQFDAALSAFTQALTLDDQLAIAAAEIGFLYIMKAEEGVLLETFLPSAEMWAGRALALDPKSSRAWSVRGFAEGLRPQTDWRFILEATLKAIKYGPRDAIAHNAASACFGYSLGLVAVTAAVREEPLYLAASVTLGDNLFSLNSSGKALGHLEYVLSLAPEHAIARANQVMVLADLRRGEEAARQLDRLRPLVASGQLPAIVFSALEYQVEAERGNTAVARSALAQVRTVVEDPATPGSFLTQTVVAMAPFLARHGQAAEAIRLMERAQALGSVPVYDWLVLDDRLAPLRSDPRFARILAASRARFIEMIGVLETAKSRDELPGFLVKPLADLRAKLKL